MTGAAEPCCCPGLRRETPDPPDSLASGSTQGRKTAGSRIGTFFQNRKPRLHCANLRLLAGNDFLGKLSDQGVFSVNQHEARHFNGTGVVWNHHGEKVAIGISGS